MHNEEYDEPGLSETDYAQMDESRKAKLDSEIRNKPENIYVIFDSENTRDAAFKIIEEARQNENELFVYLKNYYHDPKQPTLGIALEFTKFDLERANKINQFLIENKLFAKGVYDTIDGQPIN